jgi:catechol 2,3-dioxygenase-like lactoylglutathione lyase family enzyme
MAPASNAPVYIRFVETGDRVGYWPPVTWGWNATEILVQDPDKLAAQLNDSPIRRFGGPGDLYNSEKAPRAIQTLGPSGAMLYFTRILPGGSRYGLHGAKAPVDRIFNVVLGGPSLDTLRSFYQDILGLNVGEPMGFTMTLAAQACGASPDTEFPICVAPLRARNSILELDEYPENSAARDREVDCMPGGMSMVSFDTPTLDNFPVPFRATARPIHAFPYDGKRVAVAEGPAGEWLELIESGE